MFCFGSRVLVYVRMFVRMAELIFVQMAFEWCPPEFHKSLWEYRIVFLSRLGRNIAAELLKVKSLDAQLAAKVPSATFCSRNSQLS